MFRINLSITAILLFLTGCGPASEPPSTAAAPTGSSDAMHRVQISDKPQITVEKITLDIVGRVVKTTDATGTGPPTDWTFDADEFRQVEILDKQMTESEYTLVIFMTTRDNPKPGESDVVQVAGKLQLRYAWKESQWVLTEVRNLTFRYSVLIST